MPITSLYEMCVRRTSVLLLKTGTWKQWSPSPFVQIPAVAVNDIMSHLPAVLPPWETRMSSLEPLLTSGWLQHLDLLHCFLDWPICRLLDVLLECGRHLQTLVLPACGLGERRRGGLSRVSGKLEALLRMCPHLSDLHTPVPFDLRVLEHLPRLRRLSLHLPYEWLMQLFEAPDPELMGCLRHLRTLTVCGGKHQCHSALVEELLRHCPQLTSVGRLDSAFALQRLAARRDISEPLQLRSCVWETNQRERPRYLDLVQTGRHRFPLIIQNSVHMCPLLQELRIKVLHRGAIQHLAMLCHLTALDIDVEDCHDDWRHDIYRVLDEIGGGLKLLAVRGAFTTPMDVGGLCDRCPGLEYLRLQCGTHVTGPVPLTGRLPSLRSLLLRKAPRSVLLFLLGNSPHLRELSTDFSDALDDDLLMTVLGHNPLSELEEASFPRCVLTLEGLAQFLESARALRGLYFRTASVHPEMAQSTVEAINPRVVFRRWPPERMEMPTENFKSTNHLCKWSSQMPISR